MAQTRLEEMKAALRKQSRPELEELVLAYSRAHVRVCEVAGYHVPGEHEEASHRHAAEAEIRERIKGKSTEELVDILADAALVAKAART